MIAKLFKSLILVTVANISISAHAAIYHSVASRTVVIGGEIGDEQILVAKAISSLVRESKEPIYITIDSPGGQLDAGEVTIQAIRRAVFRGVKVKCFVPRLAASMAFMIFNECSERSAAPDAKLLYHAARRCMQSKCFPPDYGTEDNVAMVKELTKSLGFDVTETFKAEKLWDAKELVKVAKVGWLQVVTRLEIDLVDSTEMGE